MKAITLRYPDELDEALLKLADGVPRERYIRRLLEDHVAGQLAKQVAEEAQRSGPLVSAATGPDRATMFRQAAEAAAAKRAAKRKK